MISFFKWAFNWLNWKKPKNNSFTARIVDVPQFAPIPTQTQTDVVSENRLSNLHPKVRDHALRAYRKAVKITPKGVHPYITETLRSFQRSNDLYALGRTKPGKIVTNAAAGQSYHNYGMAIDFVNLVNGSPKWEVDENWMKVVECFKEEGFVWGGDFKSLKDYPHFEMTFGHHWRELLALHNSKQVDKDKYVLV